MVGAIGGLPTGLVTIGLDVSPSTDRVTMVVGQQGVVYNYLPIARGTNDDRWATAVAYGSDAEFDHVRVEVCP